MRGALFALILLLTGCASGPQGVGTAEAPKEVVLTGIVEAVTPVELDASSNVGTGVGGIFGQIGGANSGGGSGAVVGSIFGGVLGSTFGQQAGIATKPGLEIWVKLDETGKSTYVMQPGKADDFKVGDPVRVIRQRGKSRVERQPAKAAPPDVAPKSELVPEERSVR